jgi:RNA polymerase sigma factor (sigma-70 family)
MVDAEFLYDNAESNELISYVISDDNLIIQEYMNILNERQKDIIHKIFILGYTYDDLAKEYSVTRQAISQVVNTSFKKIRQKFTV